MSGVARHTDILRQWGLSRNPFTDRTAEKTSLDDVSLYIHSDLQGFAPSPTTYVFFGRRGSGKTTIRLQVCKRARRPPPNVVCCRRRPPPPPPQQLLLTSATLPSLPLQMQRSYEEHNAAERASGRSRGHYLVDLSRPGHLTDCLRTFQEAIDASPDNFEAAFGECGGSVGRTNLAPIPTGLATRMPHL